ncbi:hypothetical protein [Actinokineospora sp.]|uniref:hypothetical protein n=1 Tax=Actinokineospora sp. TaxID=1872133 RepID=UPI003D6B970A
MLTELAEAHTALTGFLLNVLAVSRREPDAKPVELDAEAALGQTLVRVGLLLTDHVMHQVAYPHEPYGRQPVRKGPPPS